MDAEHYRSDVEHEFRRLEQLADDAIEQIDDESFFQVAGAEENSIAILVKHMAGNMRSRWTDFLTTDGEKPDRNRDSEFVIEDGDTRESLFRRWEQGWKTLHAAIAPLTAESLSQTVTIRGEPHSVLQAIQRQISHYAYHVGQIVQIARHHAGGSWKSLSVARGGSVAFNQEPRKYMNDEKR